MPGNLTLSRLTKTTGNLVENPFLEHFAREGISGLQVASYHGSVFTYAPGWFAFGSYPATQLVTIPQAQQLKNPFLTPDQPGEESRQKSGIEIAHFGTNTQPGYDNIGGLVQRLRISKPLLGKKVRVSGCYLVREESILPTGMSVWLKGEVRYYTVAAARYVSGTASGETSGSTLTDLGATFQTDGVQAGDILTVDKQVDPYNGGFYVVSDVPDENTILIAGVFDTDAVGITYAIAKQDVAPAHRATFVGRAGIALFGTIDVGHVVRWCDGGDSYTEGDEWIIRAFDSLVVPQTAVGDTPLSTSKVLAFRTYNPAANALTGFDLLQGPLPGDTTKVYYLDTVWDNVPANGNACIAYDTASADGDVHFFETIVEIPATLAIDAEDDLFLCVFPVDPRNVPIEDTPKVDIFALSIEMVLEEDASVEDRMLYQIAQGALGGRPDFGVLGGDLRHYLQYPVYRPFLLPFNSKVMPYYVADVIQETTATGTWWAHGDGLDEAEFYARQIPLGPEAVILGAALWLHEYDSFDAGVDTYFWLKGEQHKYPATVDNQMGNIIAGATYRNGGPALPAKLTLTPRRNRGGLYWPASSFGVGTVPSDKARNGVWDTWLHVVCASSAIGGCDLEISNGYIIGAADPRIPYAFWSTD
jgi:hypothetical protein